MSKDMKLIMENWRKSVISEQEELSTVGDLRAALQAAIGAKRKGIAADELKNKAVDILLDLVPGAGTIKSVAEFFINVYKMPDEKRNNTALDYLNVDDEISAVVDDRVENQFLKDTIEMLSKLPDDEPLEQISMNQRLSDYIANKYNQTKVEKGS